MPKVLLTRYGGMGDIAPLIAVAKQYKKRGWEVHFAVRDDGPNMRISDLLYKNPNFDKVMDLKQVGPFNNRVVEHPLGLCSVQTIYKDYDLVLDYMFSVEGNNTSPVMEQGPGKEWQHSRNSNWFNWFDMALAWANIDPSSVPADEKRPEFVVFPEELKSFDKLKTKYSKIITIQAQASSISRSWFQAKKLVNLLKKKYPEACILHWSNDKKAWLFSSDKEEGVVPVPKGASPLRFSMALIAASDLFVGADTGYSHIAEGLGVKHIAIYSTVPAWTRAAYYKHQTWIDPGEKNPELYTFSLGLGDPLRILEGEQQLSEREKLVDKLYTSGSTLEVAAEALNVDAQGAELELKALATKKASWERMQSKALSSVSAEEVFEKIQAIL